MVDLIVVLLLLGALALGAVRGLIAGLGLIVGVVAGGFAALWIVPWLGTLVPDAAWRGPVLVVAAIGLVAAGAALGAAIGGAIRRGVHRTRLRGLDRLLGALVGTAATALVLVMLASTVTAAGIPGISSAVASSRVLRVIDEITPPPVDQAIAQLRGLVVDEGLPRLGEQFAQILGPPADPLAPPVALDDPELQQAAASVARISGTAYACGTSLTGSGFVAEDGIVITNAHVLAGVDTPVVQLPGGEAREGRVVWFDAIDDLAAIAVDGLGAPALPIAEPVPAGTPAAVQGYPLGGPFRSVAAQVLWVGEAPVPDIHDGTASPREIYSLDADVQPGNSGGPLLTGDGEVAGVVFARGDDGANRGYAMTTTELDPVLDAVDADAATVSTGACLTR